MVIAANRLLQFILIMLVFFLPAFSQDNPAVLKKLSQKADVILIGKVVKKESAWNTSKSRIFTKTTIQVEEYLKGKDNGNTLEVIYPGGEIDGVGEIYTHMPKFENDEEALLFLKKDKKNKAYRVLSGEAGKIKIQKDKKNNEKVPASNLQIQSVKKQIKSYIKPE